MYDKPRKKQDPGLADHAEVQDEAPRRKAIKHSYEKRTGKLHADNPNHPGITEADVEEVLSNPASVTQDADFAWKWYATGPTSGKYEHLTVVFVNRKASLDTITAHPPPKRLLREYRRQKKESMLWTPADTTPTTS